MFKGVILLTYTVIQTLQLANFDNNFPVLCCSLQKLFCDQGWRMIKAGMAGTYR